jgi:two-component system cell cycle response regulator DivK
MGTKLPAGALQGWTVVIVDDEPDSLEVARILLELCGATVYTALNGQEGLQLALKHRPKLIISDLSMPGMSGWQLLHELKSNGLTRDIPVIALTAHAMEGDRARGFAAGFHNYLTKPLLPETFVHDLLLLVVDVPALRLTNTKEID